MTYSDVVLCMKLIYCLLDQDFVMFLVSSKMFCQLITNSVSCTSQSHFYLFTCMLGQDLFFPDTPTA